MKLHQLIGAAGLTLLSLSSQADDLQQIAAANEAEWNAAFAKGRVDEIVSLYTQDAILVQPNGTISRDGGEIRKFWQNLITQGALKFNLVDIHSDRDDTIVTTSTVSDLKQLKEPNTTMSYSYDGVLYSVLKRQHDGHWKLQAQQWSGKHRT